MLSIYFSPDMAQVLLHPPAALSGATLKAVSLCTWNQKIREVKWSARCETADKRQSWDPNPKA